MKAFLLSALLILITPLMAEAHGDHGIISGQKAISIANASIKRLAFKDFGFEVGKLDESWKSISKDALNVVDVKAGFYVVSANNETANKTIYLQIRYDGRVLDVRANNRF